MTDTAGEIVRALLDRQEIADLIHRRARAADRRDVELARTCYHPDATEDHAGYVGRADAFLGHAPTGNPDHPIKTMWHGIHSSLVELDGETAHAETYFSCVVVMDVDGELRDGMTAGRYLDTLVRHEGRWVILARTLIFDWSRVDEPTVSYWDARKMDSELCHFGADAPADLVYRLNA